MEEQTSAVFGANSPLLWHGEPVLVFTITLGVLLHGGAGVGHKGLLHGLADSQAQKPVRPGQPSLPGHNQTWDTDKGIDVSDWIISNKNNNSEISGSAI